MNKKNFYIRKFFYFLLLIYGSSEVVSGYDITVKVQGLKKDTISLAYYYGNKTFVEDTALLDSNGKGRFTGDGNIPGGIYLLVLPNKSFIELLINEDDIFLVQTDSTGLLKNTIVEGATETEIFLKYQQEVIKKQQLSNLLKKAMYQIPVDDPKRAEIKHKIESLDGEVHEMWNEIIRAYPGTFLATFIKALKPVEIPDFNIEEEVNNQDSLRWYKAYNYNKDHYFDHIDFRDDRLLRTPVLHKKLHTYFTRILYHHPDSIIPPMHRIIDKSMKSDKMYQYVLSYIFNLYNQEENHGMGKVVVELADKYYLNGKTPWTDHEFKMQLTNKVNKIKRTHNVIE